ncbi:transcriptional repressor [Variovorax sp. J22R133]|uniref:transcriptional repressor n=1 Tax=Variovorax brevis TaxID=3053503 RepID=UPI002578A5A3|nr:transcriptional repressor [Variovorax sp. J22R133]MDM0115155.1 transcriptional repressor [Variovorax sp. J22R133]
MLELSAPLRPRQDIASGESKGVDQSLAKAELIARIRTGLGRQDRRRVGPHHADVLATLLAMKVAAPDVHGIYRALLDAGRDMPMSKVYRALKVLEDAGVVQRAWMPGDGRVRSVYFAIERRAEAALDGHAIAVCTRCGASITSDACRTEPDPR